MHTNTQSLKLKVSLGGRVRAPGKGHSHAIAAEHAPVALWCATGTKRHPQPLSLSLSIYTHTHKIKRSLAAAMPIAARQNRVSLLFCVRGNDEMGQGALTPAAQTFAFFVCVRSLPLSARARIDFLCVFPKN